jgi:hypothetical protein
MVERAARITAFGFDAKAARVEVIPRSRGWRTTRALLAMAIGAGVAPVVFILPPHVPWALAAIGAGAFFARRFATERETLLRVEGHCPRCGAEIRVETATPLREPHVLHCGGCLGQVLVE